MQETLRPPIAFLLNAPPVSCTWRSLASACREIICAMLQELQNPAPNPYKNKAYTPHHTARTSQFLQVGSSKNFDTFLHTSMHATCRCPHAVNARSELTRTRQLAVTIAKPQPAHLPPALLNLSHVLLPATRLLGFSRT